MNQSQSFAILSGKPSRIERYSRPEYKSANPNSPLWKRVIVWGRGRAASAYGIVWGDAEQNK